MMVVLVAMSSTLVPDGDRRRSPRVASCPCPAAAEEGGGSAERGLAFLFDSSTMNTWTRGNKIIPNLTPQE